MKFVNNVHCTQDKSMHLWRIIFVHVSESLLNDLIHNIYLSLANHMGIPSVSNTPDLVHSSDWSKLDETLRKLPVAQSKMVYFDEDNDLNFFNPNPNLFNTTEQTVYVVRKYRLVFVSVLFFVLYYRMIIVITMYHTLFRNHEEYHCILSMMVINLHVFKNLRINIEQRL